MPWWGWLILACVALIVVGQVAVAVIGARTVRRISGRLRSSGGRR